jgi:nitric oxide reductase NorD protein
LVRRPTKDFLKLVTPETAPATPPLLRGAAAQAFAGPMAAAWLAAVEKLSQAGYGDTVVASYRRYSPEIADKLGPNAAIALADSVSLLAIKAGRKSAELLSAAAAQAAGRVADAHRFRAFLNLMERLASLAPESVPEVLTRTDRLLSRLDVSRLEAWALAGIRYGGGEAQRRFDYFSFADPEAERWLERESSDVTFEHVGRRLKFYLDALWRIRLPIREPSLRAPEATRRRTSFDRGMIRVPPVYPGFRDQQAEEIFRAALAHVAAHLTFTRDKFPARSLKPVQIALVSLIEDARVEQLAMREYPGLRRLWLPFHVAQPSGAKTAPALLARLSRALIDPDFEDPDGWVQKSKEMFYAAREHWGDQQMSRVLGSLLGNDLGQMRVQFNAKTYVPEPPYRDENSGLWDWGEQPNQMAEEELLDESVRIVRQEEKDLNPPDRERQEPERDEGSTNRARPVEEEPVDIGIPVARYPEHDHLTGRDRPDWVTVKEYEPHLGNPDEIERAIEANPELRFRIQAMIRAAKVSRPRRRKRMAEGEQLDLDAAIEAVLSQRIGESPDPRIYATVMRQFRDLSVLLLLDVSESTNDPIKGSRRSTLELEKQAVALLGEAMEGLGDPFAVAAFCSDGREDVHYLRIKDFGERFGALPLSRLAGLTGSLSTRMGAAIRHAGAELAKQTTYRRLLLLVTDGEPSDRDVPDRRYLVEDARYAVMRLTAQGIDTLCVGLDSGAENHLARIFGPRNTIMIDRIDRLPDRLPSLYFRLTR